MKEIIYINEINPNIRYASHHQLAKGYDSTFRHLRHYQMMYVYKGEGKFIVFNKVYKGEKGDLFLWSSQQAHRVISSKEFPLTIFGLQFDLTKETEDKIYPISWCSPENYKMSMANEDIQLSEIPNLPNKFHIDNMVFYENLMFELVKEYRNNLVNSKDICESILKTILICTLRNNLYANKSRNKTKIDEVIQFIFDHIDQTLSNESIADEFNYHKNYLNRLFKAFTNQSLHQFVIEAKINKAVELMQTTDLTLTQIADQLGFSSLQHFSKQFKQKIGKSPSILMSNKIDG